MSSLRQLSAVLALAALAACGDPEPGPNPVPPRVVSRVVDLAPGAQCAAGGRAVTSGADDDLDGVLDDGEVDRTDVVCLPAPTAALVRRADEPASAACPHGGVVIHSGLDDDRDGALDDAEVEHTERVCHPAAARAVAREDAVAAGDRCASGGVAVATGIDDDGDAVLDDAEIDNTTVLCHEAGPAVLVRRDAEPAGERCPHGGTAVQAGADDDRDAILDDAEIDQVSVVCTGAPEAVAVRTAAEPAGDHCAHGGTAVATGIDDDRDGALDDAEIDEVRYVCGDAPATVLVRSAVEPAGDHCAHGGTAVATGIDDDRDGSLDDAEVDQVGYVCDGAPDAVATRTAAEPAGERCPHGGTAVTSGIDDDHDGALDDAEVDMVSVVCADAPATVVVRSADEPAGDHCLHGGIAVASGIDDDRDGALDDAEIDHTSYVCHAPPPAVLVRADAAPAGAPCPHGGTAVSSGIDDDRDGALDDGEIDQTAYVCSPAPSVSLIRRDPLPVGAEACPDGGVTVHGGIDDDGDGVLADAEIETTTHVCDVAEIVDGDLTLDASTSPAQLARYAAVRVITGSLIIGVDGVDLPALEVVGDSLIATEGVTTVALPGLTRVGGVVALASTALTALDLSALAQAGTLSILTSATMTEVALPALTGVLGDLAISGAPRLSAPLLARVGGDLRCRDPRAPALVTIGGELQLVGDVFIARLEALTSVAAIRSSAGTDIAWIHMPALTHVAGPIELLGAVSTLEARQLRTLDGALTVSEPRSLGSLELPALEALHGDLHLIDAWNLHDLELDALAVIDGSLHIEDAQNLSDVSFPRLTTIRNHGRDDRNGFRIIDTGTGRVHLPVLEQAPAIELENNERLFTVDVPALRYASYFEVSGTLYMESLSAPALTGAGALSLEANRFLATLDFPRLESAGRTFVIGDLPVTDLSGFPVLRRAGSVLVSGNDELTDLSALHRLTSVEILWIRWNERLTSLAGLGAVRRADEILIWNNRALASLTGLDGLRAVAGSLAVRGNPALADLAGLDGLRLVDGTVEITGSPLLTADAIAALIARVAP
jgi:hypothetical protein